LETLRGEFKGTRRFRVMRCIGIGGMGEVYEAFDRAHQSRVALKVLSVRKPDSLLRFKNEFRALRDLEHPNLVSFGELLEEDGAWFFTMEFIDGVDFFSYVRPGDDVDSRPTRRMSPAAMAHAPEDTRPLRRDVGYNESRLRSALAQLGCGLATLHGAGKIHRDIKPSNVRVTKEGRLVVLDFGLVTEIDRPVHLTGVEEIVGTPAFVAPEQAGMRDVGPEADWYSVGVVLYLSLTRRLPFDGAPLDILMQKQQHEPPPPRTLDPGIPEDLDALCAGLLHRDPDARPREAEILRWLNVEVAPEISAASSASSQSHAPPFVGREPELTALAELFEATRSGRAATVYVHGESGVGKTAMVRHFTDALVAEQGAVVLAGSCYENELVPFKAVDGLIDALIRYMKEIPRRDAAALLPSKAALLTQVFPVLRGVEVIAEAPAPLDEVRDPQELRSRAFTAVRELLSRLGERKPLVLVVDDMQWTDADSLALLREIMRTPEAPALLLVLVERSTPAGDDPLELREVPPMPGAVHHIHLPRLPQDEARQLAEAALEHLSVADQALARDISEEAAGHPLFIHELARHAHSAGGKRGALILDEVLWARIESLGAEAREILEVLAVAGAPLPKRTAARALSMDFAEFSKRASLLRLAHLLRQSDIGQPDCVEPYHDRVRAAVLARLDDDNRRARHRRLALALEASRSGDLEALAIHWSGAGDRDKAVIYALQAAAQAAAIFAFDRAAQLYRFALDLGIADPVETKRTRRQLGDALRNAGLGARAAEAYLEAAAGANAAEKLELHRRAAEELLLSGHFDDGMAVLETVLAAIGMSFPATPRKALASLVANRARLRLRGLRFRERDVSQVSAEELTRSDVSWSAAAGLSIIDNVRGADFQARNLLRALRTGEPHRIARALLIEAGHSSIGASTSERRTRRLLDRSQQLVDALGDPYGIGLHKIVSSMTHLLSGRWRRCLELGDEGDAILRARCTGVAWELDSVQMFGMDSMWFLGELRELALRLPRRIAEAQARGDLYAIINIRTGAPTLLWLVEDQVDEARRQLADAMSRWSRHGVHVQHYRELFSHIHIDLYAGDVASAHRRAIEGYPVLDRALLFRVELIRSIMTDLRARAAVAAAAVAGERAALLRRALHDARTLARAPLVWTEAASRAIRAGVAAARGDRATAIAHLREAAVAFEGADMALHAAAVRHQLGLALGDDEGTTLLAAADQWMAGQGVRRPDRIAAMLVPGFAELTGG